MQKALLLGFSFITSPLYAMSFSHLDWEMACDNTHTCRMAGYQADGAAPASILLTYPAGAHAKLTAKVQILAAPAKASLWINAQHQGLVDFKNHQASLSQEQIQAVLATARQNSRIELRQGKNTWRISDRGFSAVLLKADEYQKRLGTSSALVAKGQQSSYQVRQAAPLPIYHLTHYTRAQAQHYAFDSTLAKALVPLLKKATTREDCPQLWQEHEQLHSKLTIYPLNAKQVLVERPCWQAAYNFGAGMWLMNKQLNQVQQLVSTSATSFSEGQIFSAQKGRGLGDCLSIDEWALVGYRFRPSYSAVNLQCKGFIGGAWQLPTLITQVSQ